MEFAYLAGVIDGEGCIALYRRKDKKAKRGITYAPKLAISSTDLWWLEAIRQQFGGYIGSAGNSNWNNKKKCWQLLFSSNEARMLLPGLIPHLVLKKQQAEVLLSALSITIDHRKSEYDDSELDRKVITLRDMKREGRTA
jgi:hypothetical protein